MKVFTIFFVLVLFSFTETKKKYREDIIVINNTGGGCGGRANTIVKTAGKGKKSKGGHKIILSGGGGGGGGRKKCCKEAIQTMMPYAIPYLSSYMQSTNNWETIPLSRYNQPIASHPQTQSELHQPPHSELQSQLQHHASGDLFNQQSEEIQQSMAQPN